MTDQPLQSLRQKHLLIIIREQEKEIQRLTSENDRLIMIYQNMLSENRQPNYLEAATSSLQQYAQGAMGGGMAQPQAQNNCQSGTFSKKAACLPRSGATNGFDKEFGRGI